MPPDEARIDRMETRLDKVYDATTRLQEANEHSVKIFDELKNEFNDMRKAQGKTNTVIALLDQNIGNITNGNGFSKKETLGYGGGGVVALGVVAKVIELIFFGG